VVFRIENEGTPWWAIFGYSVDLLLLNLKSFADRVGLTFPRRIVSTKVQTRNVKAVPRFIRFIDIKFDNVFNTVHQFQLAISLRNGRFEKEDNIAMVVNPSFKNFSSTILHIQYPHPCKFSKQWCEAMAGFLVALEFEVVCTSELPSCSCDMQGVQLFAKKCPLFTS